MSLFIFTNEALKEVKLGTLTPLASKKETSSANDPLELLLRVITVSLETYKIVAGLPKLKID
jgi:hypothetical protein